MQDPKAFNSALESISPAYREYAQAKLKGWQTYTSDQQSKQTATTTTITTKTTTTTNDHETEESAHNSSSNSKKEEYKRPRVILGTSEDYACHYERYLNPKLSFPSTSTSTDSKNTQRCYYFLDFGAAPGGLCKSLLQKWSNNQSNNNNNDNTNSSSISSWEGLAVTLGPNEGGLELDEDMLKHAKMENVTSSSSEVESHFSSRLHVRYRDVCDAEAFEAACSNPLVNFSDDKNNNNNDETKWHWADFVNCGIVLDAKVKSKKSGKVIGYGEQLFIQLTSAMKALRNDGEGDLMIALRFDFPSLPETIPTIDLFRQHAKKGMFILPTLYTESAGRKQFYLLVRGIVMTEELCLGVKDIWNRGRERYVKLRAEIVGARNNNKNDNDNNNNHHNQDRHTAKRRERENDDDDDNDNTTSENDKKDDDDNQQQQQVYNMVQRVYQSVGPTLDEFCGLISNFLQKSLKV